MDDKDDIDGDWLPEKSKSQKKREASALQELGEQLIQLQDDTLSRMHLPDELLDAVLAAKKIHQHGGRKRQLQYIGKLMRAIDAEPIQQQLSDISLERKRETARFHQIENWRDQLIQNTPGILDELFSRFPDLDGQHLRQLTRNAQSEAKTMHYGKHCRALFRYLQELDRN